jgi:hypothetical protein
VLVLTTRVDPDVTLVDRGGGLNPDDAENKVEVELAPGYGRKELLSAKTFEELGLYVEGGDEC